MLIISLVTLSTGKSSRPEIVPPGTSIELPDEEARQLIARGFAKPSNVAVVINNELLDALVDAIADLPPEAFGKDKRPTVKALEAVLGLSVTAADRDKAWDAYQQLIDDDKRDES